MRNSKQKADCKQTNYIPEKNCKQTDDAHLALYRHKLPKWLWAKADLANPTFYSSHSYKLAG